MSIENDIYKKILIRLLKDDGIMVRTNMKYVIVCVIDNYFNENNLNNDYYKKLLHQKFIKKVYDEDIAKNDVMTNYYMIDKQKIKMILRKLKIEDFNK